MNKNTKIYNDDGKPCKTCGELYHYPSKSTVKSMNQSEKDYKEGKRSPLFSNAEDSIKWLNDAHARYLNGECSCGKKNCKKEETWNKNYET